MDLVITWPKSRPLASYLLELRKAERWGQVINYRVPSKPRVKPRPERCYMVHDGAIRGWNAVIDLAWRGEHSVTDPITGAFWASGWYVVRDPQWHEIEPVPMAGFRGFRYIGEIEVAG